MSSPKQAVYKEFLNKRTQSTIWEHFLREDNGQSVQCKHCQKILKTAGGSTAALHTHMRSRHGNQMGEPSCSQHHQVRGSEYEPPAKKSKQTLKDYYSCVLTMEARVTRMAALDGIPFSKFCTSEDLRYLFKQSGYDLPKSPTTIAKIILDTSDKIKAGLIRKFKEMKSQNQRFTATFDEWSSTRNRRYLNVNIHHKDLGLGNHKNLGLVRIQGSMAAEVGIQLLRQHLSEFGLDLEGDIISFTTDGASVMIKMGKIFTGHHQLCFAHGIQLAVIDVLYKNQNTLPVRTEPMRSALAPEETDTDITDAEEDAEDGFSIEEPRFPEPQFLYKDLIKKVRGVVKSFHKSPLKNDLLQKYTSEEYGKGLALILDCKTRWSSLSDMIGRFLKLKTCVLKALLDLKSNVKFTEIEIEDLQNIHNSLDLIKTTVLSLCRRDANLVTADAALRFMQNKLDLQSSELSGQLASSLRQRIKERRTTASGVLQYLHNNEDFFTTAASDTFEKPSSDEIKTFIEQLLDRVQFKKAEILEESPRQGRLRLQQPAYIETANTATTSSGNGQEDLTFAQELDKELHKATTASKNVSTANRDLDSIIRVEMCIYDSTGGGREVYLNAAYNYLLTIQPTSVEAERAFSSAGYFCNKLRSSLGDKSLDALSFMRAHYQEKKQ